MKKILSLIALLFLSVSCASYLNQDPEFGLSKDRFDEIANDDPDKVFSAILQGMHVRMATFDNVSGGDHNHFGQKGWDYLFGFHGNDFPLRGRFSMSLWDYVIDYRGENFVRTVQYWDMYYKQIADANMIIGSVDADNTDKQARIYRATALAFRGYAYYYLANIYQFPYWMGSEKPGVPLVTEENVGIDQPRSSLALTYDRLISDLKTAQDIFTEVGLVKGAPTEMDATVCAMYLMRAYMEKGDYDNAITQANLVIANYSVLEGRDELWQGFSDVALPSTVFGFVNTAETTRTYASYFSQMDTYGAGYARIGIARYGFEPLMVRISDTDERLHWWSSKRSSQILYDDDTPMLRDTPYTMEDWGYDFEYVTCKFIGAGRKAILADPTLNEKKGASGWQYGDYIYLRAEEAYLVKAEALAQKGLLSDAVKALEDFVQTRDAAYVCPVSAKEDVIEEIIFHKRVEFWGECGLEYLDNRRLNIPIDRTVPGSNHTLDVGRFKMQQNDRALLYQIPVKEITANTALTSADQNE